MFDGIINFFKRIGKKEQEQIKSKETAKERLHLVLMQDRANVSADFLEIMKQEIIEVIKKYIDVDEKEIDVRLTNRTNEDGTTGAPALYANIPIAGIKQNDKSSEKEENKCKIELTKKVADDVIEVESKKEEENKDKEEVEEKKESENEIKSEEDNVNKKEKAEPKKEEVNKEKSVNKSSNNNKTNKKKNNKNSAKITKANDKKQ